MKKTGVFHWLFWLWAKTIGRLFTRKAPGEVITLQGKGTRPRSFGRSLFPALVHTAFYGKSTMRCCLREKIRLGVAVVPSSTVATSADGRTRYRIFSDGSYRRIRKLGGRQVITV